MSGRLCERDFSRIVFPDGMIAPRRRADGRRRVWQALRGLAGMAAVFCLVGGVWCAPVARAQDGFADAVPPADLPLGESLLSGALLSEALPLSSAVSEFSSSVPSAALPSLLAFPEGLTGMWAMPGCGDRARIAMIFTTHFSLTGMGDRYAIRPAAPAVMRGDVIEMRYEERPYKIKPSGGDLFFYHDAQLAMLGGDGLTDAFAQPEYAYTLLRYHRCGVVPDMDADGMAALSALDGVAAACAGAWETVGDSCRRAGFAAFDADRSGALDEDELKAAYRKTLFLVAGTHCGVRFPGEGEQEAAAFAAAALRLADRDGDGALGMGEVEAAWKILGAHEDAAKYVRLLHMMKALIPAVPPAREPEPPCPCTVSGSGLMPEDGQGPGDAVPVP